VSGLDARAIVEGYVRRELFGPPPDELPRGESIDCSGGALHFDSAGASRGIWHVERTGQEILTSDPLRRYGIGVLYNGGTAGGLPTTAGQPRGKPATEQSGDVDISWVSGLATTEDNPEGPPVELPRDPRYDEPDSDDFDLTDANTFKPSAMAISLKCRVPAGGRIALTVVGAYYDRINVHVKGYSRPWEWWARRPFGLTGDIHATDLLNRPNQLLTVPTTPDGPVRIQPAVQVYARPVPAEPDPQLRLVTVAVVNNTSGSGALAAFFQMGFTATAADGLTIEPYPEVAPLDADEEEQSIELLYRHKRTFAIGHGCAAVWDEDASGEDSTPSVRADALPSYEVGSLTPNVYIRNADGSRTSVVISMDELSQGTEKGDKQVEAVLSLYDAWIADRRQEIGDLPARMQDAARRHMTLCAEALERMRVGWAMVATDPIAQRAFRLANEAMLYQQVRSRFDARPVEVARNGTFRVIGPHPAPVVPTNAGNWRPFQIAFILASLPELLDRTHEKRTLVDLIFFPTGGGKTEAYLGASAISMLARRLRNPDDFGTDTLMRYTLRLLTAQQFLRAASLICVLEDIRSRNETELGTARFAIGIWLGGSSTPNRWDTALAALSRMKNDARAQNEFLLLRCPWCGTKMGRVPDNRSREIAGYEAVRRRVVFRCPDGACRFGGRNTLPVHVVDEDIYDVRPSLVIGTVDKFAMLAWRPEAGRIFGLDDDGTRLVSPPGLIIQDELHLISGPLGSMVGLYEPVIEDLCTDKRGNPPAQPKIIASTATIRRYESQIRNLYGREEVRLFPPQGLEEGHSFFAEPATTEDGQREPGRRYVGIMSASLGSMQTVQTRVAAATLQAALDIPEADRDGYWTNLNFLNSLRELGNTVSLLQSDVPDYLTGILRRENFTIQPRWPRVVMELTSRRPNDEIPQAIEQLQASLGAPDCVDICLASNIIEVGVDIDRLGLMTIVGQPKTNSQYIQVSGRIGRRPDVSPGLVLTIYGAAKPRDRSHYERFQTYHQQLYAQVEPTSVTPFATPVLQRALHAAAVAHIRQQGPTLEPYPFPAGAYNQAIELLLDRAVLADPDEISKLKQVERTRAAQWGRWERTKWSANVQGGDPKQGLMRYAGTLPDLDSKATIWDVPTSMRNVDAECRLQISDAYQRAAAYDEMEDGTP
jgi:hypothetical protein